MSVSVHKYNVTMPHHINIVDLISFESLEAIAIQGYFILKLYCLLSVLNNLIVKTTFSYENVSELDTGHKFAVLLY